MLKRTIYILLFLAVVAAGVFVVLNRNACHTLLDEPVACEKSASPMPVAEPTTAADPAAEVEMPADSLRVNK